MKKIILLILTILIIFPCYINAQGYDENYSEWSETKTGNYGEVEKIQYGYCLGTYPETIEDDAVIYDISNENFYKQVHKYTYVYSQIYETNQFDIIDTKANQGIVWSKYLDGYHLTELVSDIDMANCSTWSNYKQPKVDLYDDSGFLMTIQNANDNVMVNGHWNGDITIKGTLYMYAYKENDLGRNWTGAGGSNYIKCYKKMTKTSSWVYSYTEIEDLEELIQEVNVGYVLPEFQEPKGWRFDEPYDNSNGNIAIKAVQRKVYSYPLGFNIIYHLDGGSFIGDYPKTYYIGTQTKLTEAQKTGYDFIGWYLDNDFINGPIEQLDDNYKGDIDLYAKYQRKAPTLKVTKEYLYKNDREQIEISEVLAMAQAYDELDGDITNNIFIEKIEYLESSLIVDNPINVETNLSRKIIATFTVYNSGLVKATNAVQLYLLTSGEDNNIQIYSRYISVNYLDTLDTNSRWKDSNYAQVLNKYLQMMEE